jgi:hypothetical protein
VTGSSYDLFMVVLQLDGHFTSIFDEELQPFRNGLPFAMQESRSDKCDAVQSETAFPQAVPKCDDPIK